jgi:pyridoxal/pyridoxine/pyridoxamine kinase
MSLQGKESFGSITRRLTVSCQHEKHMKKEEFEKLVQDWQSLNEEYDAYILAFLANPQSSNELVAKMDLLKEMQRKLFDLENKCFEIAEGKIALED